MKTPWDPSTPIQTMFSCIRKAAEFSNWANKPITKADQIAAGKNRILEAGIMPAQYQEWRAKIEPDRSTWLQFILYWTNAYNSYNKCVTTAKSVGFSGSAEEKKEDNKDPIKRLCKAFTKNNNNWQEMAIANQQGLLTLGEQLQALANQVNQGTGTSNQQTQPPPGFQQH